jgi:hypothetical protein
MRFPCHAHASEGLECVFPIWFTQCDCVWFTLAMPCSDHAVLLKATARHSTAVERRPVGYLPLFVFFRLPCGVPRRLLSEAYQSSSQRSIPTTVKSDSSTLQKWWSVLYCWTSRSDISSYYVDFHEGHGTVGAWQGHSMTGKGMDTACYVWIGL